MRTRPKGAPFFQTIELKSRITYLNTKDFWTMAYYVRDGVTSTGLTLNNVSMFVSSGGIANSTTVNSSGYLRISVGGIANSTTVNSSGYLRISSGGTANYTTVNSRGYILISRGGTANFTTVNTSGYMIFSGGTANFTTVNSNGYVMFSGGGTANNNTVNSEGQFYVYSGGTANYTTVNSGGNMLVSSGGTAIGIMENGGFVNVCEGAEVSFLAYSFDGLFLSGSYNNFSSATVHSGTTANNTILTGYGILYVFSGGIANNTSANASGWLFLSSGGIANNTTVNSSGSIDIYSGGMANNNIISSGGSIEISSGGTANNNTVNLEGWLYISSGGIANNNTINSDGWLFISSGGTANNTIVNEGGSMCIFNGGTANSVIVSSAGMATVIQGGKLSGQITVERGAFLFLNQNTVLDFDLTQTSAGASALVNGFSRIIDGASYTLTVGENQPTGIYQLARNVLEFDKTISITDLSGTTLGTLSVGQPVNVGNVSYNLNLINSSLFLSIREPGPDTIAPAVFSVRQSHSDPTMQPVTVTAEFADDVELKSALYRIGENGVWTDYASGVNLTENATVYFKAVDASGNESEVVSHSVTNIEKRAHDPVYVYLDFDGGNTSYHNRGLDLSFVVKVANPGYSDAQKRTILSELADKYAADGVAFTLTRPEDVEYSTLYFGTSDDFADYGDYFGISETLDNSNLVKDDKAFVLLDSTFSLAQVISVAENALDHILGYTCSKKDELQLRDYAVNSYLLSTEWHQHDPYNRYCPIDPETGYRCVTGCANTASAQIIYYWIETGMLDFSLSLDDSDVLARIENNGNSITIDADPRTAEKYGYLSFAETNEILSHFRLGDTDSIAALNFAVGVLQQASYSGWQAQAGIDQELFIRSGFQSSSNQTCHGYSKASVINKDTYGLTDLGQELLIQDLLAGHPAAASIDSINHAVVIDGYNSITGEYHLNFGWGGGRNNGWYSPDSDIMKSIDYLYRGFIPETKTVLFVSELSFELDAVKQGKDIVVNLGMSNSGNVTSPTLTVAVAPDCAFPL